MLNLITFVVIWEGVNRVIHNINNQNREYNSRYCSNIHAIIITLFYLIHIYISEFNNETCNNINILSCGYVFFDLYRAIKNKEYEFILHHFVMIFTVLPGFLLQYGYNILPMHYYYFVGKAYLAESSTIFLNNCWLLIKNNKKNSLSFKINSVFLLIMFFIFRIINFSVILYEIINLKYNYFIILHLPLTVLNYVWFFKLLKKSREVFIKNI